MKKLLLILAVILLCSTKCKDTDQTSYVFEKSYSQVEEDKVLHDIDSLLTVYKIEHLTLDKWMTLKMDKDDGYIEQKVISRYGDTTTTAIYYKYVISDSTYYDLKIRQQIVKTK